MTAPTYVGLADYYTPFGLIYNHPAGTFLRDFEPPISLRTIDVDFSQDGNYVAFFSSEVPGLYVFNTSDWSEVTIETPSNLSGDGGLAFSPDSAYLACAQRSVSPVEIWETTGWTKISITGPVNAANNFSCNFSAEGNLLACGHQNNVSPGYQIFDVNNSFAEIDGYPAPTTGVKSIVDIAINETAGIVALAYQAAPKITVVDLTTKSILWEGTDNQSFNNNGAKPLSISPDGTILAVTNQNNPYLHFYDPRTGTPISTPSGGNACDARSTSCDFSPDGDYFLVGHWADNNPAYTWWDTATWTRTKVTNTGQNAAALACAFNGSAVVGPPPAAAQNAIFHGTDF